MSGRSRYTRQSHATTARPRRSAAALAGLGIVLALPMLGACSSDSPDPPSAAAQAPSAPPAPPKSVKQLASTLGCKPKNMGKFADYRQALCKASSGTYVINTFKTDQGKVEWLKNASTSGAQTYLVGTRWVVSSTPQLLGPLQKKLGGQITNGSSTY